MFFTGSLQEGVALALQQSRCVFCFVTDEQEASQRWESKYLTEESIATLLRDEAVVLRLKQGSEEAGFLAAIFPLPSTPTVVIIKNGDLKEYLVGDISMDEFVRRVTTALRGAQGQSAATQPAGAAGAAGTAASSTPAPTPAPAPVPAPATTTSPAPAAEATDDLYDPYDETPSNPPQANTTQSQPRTQAPPANSNSRSPATATQENENSAAIRAVLAERAARLEAQRVEHERKAREARAAQAEADNSKQSAQTRSHKEALKTARQEAAEEKARILKKIEDDRAERRAKAAERAALRQKDAEPKLGEVAAALTRSDSSSLAPSSSSANGMTALQIRLLDGSIIRNRFPSGKKLAEVRKWVDEARTDGSKEPYRFKVVLAPLPSRRIDDTEEDKSLVDLELSPSSTLLLAPVGAHASAYQGEGVGGMLLTFLMMPLSLLQWLWGMITGVYSGLGRRDDEDTAEPVTVREQRKGRFSQFENKDDRRRDQQFYNGNSTNFEPRPDEKKNG